MKFRWLKGSRCGLLPLPRCISFFFLHLRLCVRTSTTVHTFIFSQAIHTHTQPYTLASIHRHTPRLDQCEAHGARRESECTIQTHSKHIQYKRSTRFYTLFYLIHAPALSKYLCMPDICVHRKMCINIMLGLHLHRNGRIFHTHEELFIYRMYTYLIRLYGVLYYNILCVCAYVRVYLYILFYTFIYMYCT